MMTCTGVMARDRVRKHWITPEEVLSYCEYGYIECTEKMFTGLYLLPTFSEEEFVKLLRKIYTAIETLF